MFRNETYLTSFPLSRLVATVSDASQVKMPRCVAAVEKQDRCRRQGMGDVTLCWQHARMEEKLDDCPICLDKLRSSLHLIKLGVCGHLFHSTCMSIWTSNKDTCPVCRSGVCTVDIVKLHRSRAAGVSKMISSLPPLIRSDVWRDVEEFVDSFQMEEINFIPVPR